MHFPLLALRAVLIWRHDKVRVDIWHIIANYTCPGFHRSSQTLYHFKASGHGYKSKYIYFLTIADKTCGQQTSQVAIGLGGSIEWLAPESVD
jgi:hypothetical protein